jgi:hypothetical protein
MGAGLMKVLSRCFYPCAMIALALSCPALAAEPERGLTEQALKQHYFKGIRAERGDLILQLKDTEGSYLYRRGEEQPASAASGETITLHPGESLAFVSRHIGLKFSPLPKPLERNGFFVRRTFNARSFGRGVTRQDVIILILPGGLRFVETPPGLDPANPLPADLHKQVNELIEQRTPLSAHSLHAETPGGKATPPFPASATKLVFEWKFSPGASGEPMEIRWIAADTGGVAPKNHVISSSKSEPGKTAGAFTLTKPTSGFPPGKYRIELQQAGKIIYKEDFIIR